MLPGLTIDALPRVHAVFTVLEIALAVAVAVVAIWVVRGRPAEDFGPRMDRRLGWLLMETPALVLFVWWFLSGPGALSFVPLYFLALWVLHHANRAIFLPLQFLDVEEPRQIPVIFVAGGIAFGVLNAWVNAAWLAYLGDYTTAWLADPRAWLGTALFFGGLMVHLWATIHLLRQRRNTFRASEPIPEGGLFRWVSRPQDLGELVQWFGWALATWSVAGLAFAAFRAAHLIPSALQAHDDLRASHADYPEARRALVPFLL